MHGFCLFHVLFLGSLLISSPDIRSPRQAGRVEAPAPAPVPVPEPVPIAPTVPVALAPVAQPPAQPVPAQPATAPKVGQLR